MLDNLILVGFYYFSDVLDEVVVFYLYFIYDDGCIDVNQVVLKIKVIFFKK